MRPRRKHFGHGQIAQSPQGRTMLAMLHAYLGSDVAYTPVAFVRPDAHVFMLRGLRGHALLVERTETRDESVWVHVAGARLGDSTRGPALNLEMTTHSWDAWGEAERTGNRSVIDGPRAARYRLQEARRVEIARQRDRLVVTCIPHADASATLAGLPYDTLLAGYPHDASAAITGDDSAPGEFAPDEDITLQLELIRTEAGQEESIANALAVLREAGQASLELLEFERSARKRLDAVLAAHPCICACDDVPCECRRCMLWCENRLALDRLQPSPLA